MAGHACTGGHIPIPRPRSVLGSEEIGICRVFGGECVGAGDGGAGRARAPPPTQKNSWEIFFEILSCKIRAFCYFLYFSYIIFGQAPTPMDE